MVRVKICGITNWADARLAVTLGADALGFNFYEQSPRYVTPTDARIIVRRLPRRVLIVGVFVNAPSTSVVKIARSVDLNAVQLHGEESPEDVRRTSEHFPVIKAFRMRNGFRLGRLADYGDAGAFLLDGFDDERRGGTGKTFDWRRAREARKYGATIVAGGLTPENVARAIAEAEPMAVDVCSGVEARPGKKDPGKLEALMSALAALRMNGA